MHTEGKKRIIIRSIILIIGLCLAAGASMAQLTCSAKIQATIVRPDDVSDMSLSSEDGTQFVLKNGMNSCFNVSIDGLQPVLEGKDGKQAVNYRLSFNQWQSVFYDVISIRLNVLFSKEVKEGRYVATSPYMISVHYN
jgi:hypothetical protein